MDVNTTHAVDTSDLNRFWEVESMGITANKTDYNSIQYLHEYQVSCFENARNHGNQTSRRYRQTT
jgi:hypothetical protein